MSSSTYGVQQGIYKKKFRWGPFPGGRPGNFFMCVPCQARIPGNPRKFFYVRSFYFNTAFLATPPQSPPARNFFMYVPQNFFRAFLWAGACKCSRNSQFRGFRNASGILRITRFYKGSDTNRQKKSPGALRAPGQNVKICKGL